MGRRGLEGATKQSWGQDKFGEGVIRGLGYTETAISIWEPNAAVGGWTPMEAKWSHTRGSPVCDLSDLLTDLLTPVGDDKGHPSCRLTLRESGLVNP